jgi:nitrogen-specific signal transduction histidine kinase
VPSKNIRLVALARRDYDSSIHTMTANLKTLSSQVWNSIQLALYQVSETLISDFELRTRCRHAQDTNLSAQKNIQLNGALLHLQTAYHVSL